MTFKVDNNRCAAFRVGFKIGVFFYLTLMKEEIGSSSLSMADFLHSLISGGAMVRGLVAH